MAGDLFEKKIMLASVNHQKHLDAIQSHLRNMNSHALDFNIVTKEQQRKAAEERLEEKIRKASLRREGGLNARRTKLQEEIIRIFKVKRKIQIAREVDEILDGESERLCGIEVKCKLSARGDCPTSPLTPNVGEDADDEDEDEDDSEVKEHGSWLSSDEEDCGPSTKEDFEKKQFISTTFQHVSAMPWFANLKLCTAGEENSDVETTSSEEAEALAPPSSPLSTNGAGISAIKEGESLCQNAPELQDMAAGSEVAIKEDKVSPSIKLPTAGSAQNCEVNCMCVVYRPCPSSVSV